MVFSGNEKELTEMKFRAGNLSIEIKTISHRIVHELKVNEENLRKELRATLNSLETTATNLATTRAELISAKSDFADLTTKLNNRTSEIVDIGKMPSSCSDLQRMGHKLSGFFSVKGSQKLEMVYCDFYPNQNGSMYLSLFGY
uniref:Uncharacterized protein n=1 Tax=Daphnia galeata TaxID=27404 RepID=A0A8J2RV73_9CRUS|nr:unnamed protein product [Daphnia galeata]